MFITYENLESSEARLREIEIPFKNHLEFGKDNIRSMSSTSSHADAKPTKNRTKARMLRIITKGFVNYKSTVDHHIDERLAEMKLKLENVTKRYCILS